MPYRPKGQYNNGTQSTHQTTYELVGRAQCRHRRMVKREEEWTRRKTNQRDISLQRKRKEEQPHTTTSNPSSNAPADRDNNANGGPQQSWDLNGDWMAWEDDLSTPGDFISNVWIKENPMLISYPGHMHCLMHSWVLAARARCPHPPPIELRSTSPLRWQQRQVSLMNCVILRLSLDVRTVLKRCGTHA